MKKKSISKKLVLTEKKDDILKSISLYVNGEQTNIYYFDTDYKYYNPRTEPRIKARFYALKSMIEKGLFPETTDWKMFDSCRSVNLYLKPENIKFITVHELNDAGKNPPSYEQCIYSSTGYGEDTLSYEKISEYLTKNYQFTQYTKLIDLDKEIIRKNVLVVVNTYGYSVYSY